MAVIKRAIVILAAVLCLMFPAAAWAELVDEQVIEFGDDVLVVDGEVYLPIRTVLNGLDMGVVWGADDQDKLLISTSSNRYQVVLNKDQEEGLVYAVASGSEYSHLAQLKEGRAYFTLAFYQEILDRRLTFVEDSNRLFVYDPTPVWEEVVTPVAAEEAAKATAGQKLLSFSFAEPAAEVSYVNTRPIIQNLDPYKVEVADRSRKADKQADAAPEAATAEINGIPVDSRPMLWPTTATRISSSYGKRGRSIHTGVDIDGDTGDPVYAAWNGVVQGAGWRGGYGNCVDIEHADGTITRYAHMSSIAVTAGQTVSRGDTIGQVGSTGRSTGSHLHFEVRKGRSTFQPLDYISTSVRQ